MRAEELLETLTDDELKNKANGCFIQAENTNLYLKLRPEEKQGALAEANFYLSALAWRSDARVARRDFWMEVGVMALIGIEILLSLIGLWVGYQQGKILEKQTTALIHMDTSTAATAKTLTSLQSAVESMNATLQMQLDALKKSAAETARTAKAGETSASTASQALHVSERAYVHVDAGVTSIPKVGEKLSLQAYFENSGRTPALDVVTRVRSGLDPASDTAEHARSIAFGPSVPIPYTSKGTIPAGGRVQTSWQSAAPLSQAELDGLATHLMMFYVFADVTYNDQFNRPHRTHFCAFLDPTTNTLLRCGSLNAAK